MLIKILAVFSVVSIVSVVAYIIGRFNGYMQGMSESAVDHKIDMAKYRKRTEELT
jgi:hypothetical protein